MIAEDEDALICDLAETYGVMNMEELPVDLLATLSCGLRENSRIKQKLNNTNLSTELAILSLILDATNRVAWLNSADGQKGIHRPQSAFKMLTASKQNQDLMTFDSGDELMEQIKSFRSNSNG